MADVPIDFGGDFSELVDGLGDLTEAISDNADDMREAFQDALDDIREEIRAVNEPVENLGDEFEATKEAGIDSMAAITGATTLLLSAVVAASAGIVVLINELRQGISLAIESEQVNVRLALAVRGAGDEAKYTAEQLSELSEELQDISVFSNSAIKQAETMLVRFNLVGDQFERVTRLAVDLASATGQDLTSASMLLGRSLEQPEFALNMLRRAGIAFEEEEKRLIKTLIDSGDQFRAQEVLLTALERRMQGSAEIMRGTYLGGWTALQEIISDIREELGAGVLVIIDDLARAMLGLDENITDTATTVADALTLLRPKIKEFFAGIKDDIIALGVTFTVLTERALQGPQLIKDAWTVLDVHIKSITGTPVTKDEGLAGIRAAARLSNFSNKESITEEIARKIVEANQNVGGSGGGLPPASPGSLPINWDPRVPFAGMVPFGSVDTQMAGRLISTAGVTSLLSAFGQGSSNLFGGLAGLGSTALGAAGGIAGNLVDDRSTFKAQFEDANSLFRRIQSSAASIDDDPQKKTAKHTETTASNTQKLVDMNASIETNIKAVAAALGKGIATVLE